MHQSYLENVLKRFYMDKSHLLSNPMLVRRLYAKKDQFRPCEKHEKIIGT